MIKIVMLLVYLYGAPAEIVVEQKSFESEEACASYGLARVEKLSEDEKFGGGLYAACVEANVVEAKK
jgi:hypothetical protein